MPRRVAYALLLNYSLTILFSRNAPPVQIKNYRFPDDGLSSSPPVIVLKILATKSISVCLAATLANFFMLFLLLLPLVLNFRMLSRLRSRFSFFALVRQANRAEELLARQLEEM